MVPKFKQISNSAFLIIHTIINEHSTSDKYRDAIDLMLKLENVVKELLEDAEHDS